MAEENRVFCMFAYKLRPKLVTTLSISVKKNKNLEVFAEPFHATMRKICEGWLGSLFSSVLSHNDLFRVWDNILIYGFEFAHKFALSLLSKNENFLKNSIKQEVKSISVGLSLDALTLAGSLTSSKLFKKNDKIPVEVLIKKALTKPTYLGLKREDLPKITENISRVSVIRDLKNHLETLGFTYEIAKSLIEALEVYENYSNVSRSVFQNFIYKNFKWDSKTVVKFFVVFDQKGTDQMAAIAIKAAIAILVTDIDRKIELLFKSIDQDASENISLPDFQQLITKAEELLNHKHCFYSRNIEKFSQKLQNLSSGLFRTLIKTDEFFNTLLRFLFEIDCKDLENSTGKDVSIGGEDFSDRMSSPEKSPISEISNGELVPDFELNHNIIVIGEKSSEISMISNEGNFDIQSAPGQMRDEHGEYYEVIKDPDYIGKKVTFNSKVQNGGRDILMESLKDVEILPANKADKGRNNCSRLCATQSCIVI